MTSAARVLGEVHDAAAVVDADGDRAVARGCRERVAAAGADRHGQREVGHDVRPEVAQRRSAGGAATSARPVAFVSGGFTCLLPSCGRCDVCGLLAAAGAGSGDQRTEGRGGRVGRAGVRTSRSIAVRAHRPVARVVCLSSGGVCARTGRLSPSRARGSGRGRVGADCGAVGRAGDFPTGLWGTHNARRAPPA